MKGKSWDEFFSLIVSQSVQDNTWPWLPALTEIKQSHLLFFKLSKAKEEIKFLYFIFECLISLFSCF